MPPAELSRRDARFLALAAQGFDRPRPKRAATVKQLADLIRRLGLLQLDFVNVLVPAHYQVPFSRLGAYDRSRLNDAMYRTGAFTERWAREASIVPVETWPRLRYRMDAHRSLRGGFHEFIDANPRYVKRAIELVRKQGPLGPEDLPEPKGKPPRAGGWTTTQSGWTAAKAVLEHHFGRGQLAVSDRKANFARLYDLPERLVPAEHLERKIDRETAQRELLLDAARAQGLATAPDLADDYRIPMGEARARVAELVEARQLREVRVEGWRESALLHPKAKRPTRIDTASLLSPFDPLMRHRERATRLFDFDYRIEIFLPAAKRKFGYYVLPFLLGDRLVARVDLKADRPKRALRVMASYRETWAKAGEVAPALAEELRAWAGWLELDSVEIERKGNLARALSAEIRS